MDIESYEQKECGGVN